MNETLARRIRTPIEDLNILDRLAVHSRIMIA